MIRRSFAVLVALSIVACSASERPEGIVERWLTSMNQGEAGAPDRYANDDVTAQVAPTWDMNDPGWIDEIVVGGAEEGAGGASLVPFRLVPLEGHPISGVATVAPRALADGSTQPVVAEVSIQEVPPQEGGWQAGMDTAAWFLAIAIGALIATVALAVVGLVDRGVRRRAAA